MAAGLQVFLPGVVIIKWLSACLCCSPRPYPNEEEERGRGGALGTERVFGFDEDVFGKYQGSLLLNKGVVSN